MTIRAISFAFGQVGEVGGLGILDVGRGSASTESAILLAGLERMVGMAERLKILRVRLRPAAGKGDDVIDVPSRHVAPGPLTDRVTMEVPEPQPSPLAVIAATSSTRTAIISRFDQGFVVVAVHTAMR